MVSRSRREFVRAAATVPLLGAWSLARAEAAMQGRILVGYPPGGSIDVTARTLADAWRPQNWSYIVDNRTGAAGRVASAQLKRQRADGTTILMTHTSALTNSTLAAHGGSRESRSSAERSASEPQETSCLQPGLGVDLFRPAQASPGFQSGL